MRAKATVIGVLAVLATTAGPAWAQHGVVPVGPGGAWNIGARGGSWAAGWRGGPVGWNSGWRGAPIGWNSGWRGAPIVWNNGWRGVPVGWNNGWIAGWNGAWGWGAGWNNGWGSVPVRWNPGWNCAWGCGWGAVGTVVVAPVFGTGAFAPAVVAAPRVVVVQAAPVVTTTTVRTQAATGVRFYCTQPPGFHPVVPSCQRPWLRVLPD